MLRQASRILGRPALHNRMAIRAFANDVSATEAGDSTFIDSWKKVIPNIEPPKTPSAFMKPRPSTQSTIPTKITVNFVLPYTSELSTKEVRSRSSDLRLCKLIVIVRIVIILIWKGDYATCLSILLPPSI